MRLIVDSQQDLAFHALAHGRDYLRPVHEIRAAERFTELPFQYGQAMFSLPDALRAGVGVIFATLTTIPRAQAGPGEWSYATPEGAHQQARAQLALYQHWADEYPPLQILQHKTQLAALLDSWEKPEGPRQLGLALLMKNADPLRDTSDLAFWIDQGLRIIGPVWQKPKPGPLNRTERHLLGAMEEASLILDISSMDEAAIRESERLFRGCIIASHANLRRFVPHPRHLPDDFIRLIADRGGVLGLMPSAPGLDPRWKDHRQRGRVGLRSWVEQVDAVCQITGNAEHVGLGSNFDGGGGAESAPYELESVGDLPRLRDHLLAYGFSEGEAQKVMGGNWIRVLSSYL